MSIFERQRHTGSIPPVTLGTLMRRGQRLLPNIVGTRPRQPSQQINNGNKGETDWLMKVRKNQVFHRPTETKGVSIEPKGRVTCSIQVIDEYKDGLAVVLDPHGITFEGTPFKKIPGDRDGRSVGYFTDIRYGREPGFFVVSTGDDIIRVRVSGNRLGDLLVEEHVVPQLATNYNHPFSMEPKLNNGIVVVEYGKR